MNAPMMRPADELLMSRATVVATVVATVATEATYLLTYCS